MVAFTRIELFDRSMAIAAQAFTSVLPMLIVSASWFAATGGNLSDAVGVPASSQPMVDQAVDAASTSRTFGVIGVLAILVSATSFSRALTRAFSAIWLLERPRSSLRSVWRWVAVVVGVVTALVTARGLTRILGDLPGATLWEVLGGFSVDAAVAFFVPVLLLAGKVRPRHLLPGAVLFAAVMLLLRPASALLLPHALAVSSDRYGANGVAFTYVGWLYLVSFVLLVTSVLGQVATTDDGRLGRLLRGG